MPALHLRRGALRLAFLLLAAPAGALAGQAPAPVEEFNDVVHVRDNNPITEIRVVSDNWDAVTVRGKGNVTIARSAEEVLAVEYATARPAEYEQAWELRRSGKIKEAIAAFEKGMAKLRDADKPQRQYFQAGLADCYDAGDELDKLAKIVDDMVNQKPAPPRLVFEMCQKLGAAYFRLRQAEKAEAAFKRLEELCKDLKKKVPPDKGALDKYLDRLQMTAEFWKYRSLEGQGKVDGIEGAQRKFMFYSGRASSYPELAAQAQIAEQRCRAVKDPEGALKALKELVAKLPEAALPELYCAVGDAYLAKAESPKTDELDYYWARWYYLKVVVQYPTDRASMGRAYYGAGRCCELLAEKAREQRAGDKAAKCFEIVGREFRDTPEYSLVKDRAGR